MSIIEGYTGGTNGTPCCQFSGGVQEFTWASGGHGKSVYKCSGCKESIEKTRGWFFKSIATQAREVPNR